jgi:hypothetical protein
MENTAREGDVLDLRTNKSSDYITIPAGTKLYTVQCKFALGTDGPYFTSPDKALFWDFVTSRKHSPVIRKEHPSKIPENGSRAWKKGEILTGFKFPSDRVLVEVVIPQKTIFTGDTIDVDILKHISFPYGRNDPAFPLQSVNTDPSDQTCYLMDMLAIGRRSTSPKRIFYYSMAAMLPCGVLKLAGENAPRWAFPLNGDLSISSKFSELYESLGCQFIGKAYHSLFLHTGIRILRSQDIFSDRYVYDINYEKIWILAMDIAMQAYDSMDFQKRFENMSISTITITSRRQDVGMRDHFGAIDSVIFSAIMRHTDSLKDAISLSLINRKFRRMFEAFDVQTAIRNEFLPEKELFFGHGPVVDPVNDPRGNFILGRPPIEILQKFWIVGCVFFKEDIEELFKPANVYNTDIMPIMQACNSFISMLAMLKSMSYFKMGYITCYLAFHSALVSVSTRLDVKCPELETGACYVTPTHSWLHVNHCPPFFLDKSYADTLSRAKILELQRFKIDKVIEIHERSPSYTEPITAEHYEVWSAMLINDLILRDSKSEISGKVMVHLRCKTAGRRQCSDKTPPSSMAVIRMHKSMARLRSYCLIMYSLYGPAGALLEETMVDEETPILPDGTSLDDYDVLSVRIDGRMTRDSIDESVYYGIYMLFCNLIRHLFRDGICDQAEWHNNF